MARVAVVTGGASGIGRATAVALTAAGVDVAVFDITGDRPVDVADLEAVEAAVAAVREARGPIDIVVNAAGIPSGGTITDPLYPTTWQRTLDVNLTGAMHVVRACAADLLASGHGRIVNIASTEALTASRRTGPYTVSKTALIGFTRSLAVDLGSQGVTANCICPGPILTGMTAGIAEEHRERFARRHVPVGRYGAPEEVAHLVVALTALEASYVNGAVIPVDGGMTAKGN
jgi:3-oxoacyl-[acyl-carrier protein] reductase